MKHQVNVAIQVLPSSKSKDSYDIVDKAIKVIKASGIRYQVCPFETVLEGGYDEIMSVVKSVQEACLAYGAESMLTNLKIQLTKDKDVTIEEKTGKY